MIYAQKNLKFFKGRPTIQHHFQMKKSVLVLLGKLLVMEMDLWNQISDNPRNEEIQKKYWLVKKIKKNLEEKSRGFLRSKVPYEKMAEIVLEFVNKESYANLHKKIMDTVFQH